MACKIGENVPLASDIGCILFWVDRGAWVIVKDLVVAVRKAAESHILFLTEEPLSESERRGIAGW
jgi:hypothetical protein